MTKRKMQHEAHKKQSASSAPPPVPQADAAVDTGAADVRPVVGDAVLEGSPALASPSQRGDDSAEPPPTQQAAAGSTDPSAMAQQANRPEPPSLPELSATRNAEAAIAVDPLMQEVQSFLSQREALSRKLAAEIEATERKLAELKQTAARLFPPVEEVVGRERKAKRVKPRSSVQMPSEPLSNEDRIPGGGG